MLAKIRFQGHIPLQQAQYPCGEGVLLEAYAMIVTPYWLTG